MTHLDWLLLSRDGRDWSVAHRLRQQSGLETKVPGRKTPKFDDFDGTKSRRSLRIRPAKAPG
jgi:hypothetical protein